jgi:hypothetical protein
MYTTEETEELMEAELRRLKEKLEIVEQERLSGAPTFTLEESMKRLYELISHYDKT